MGFSQNRGAAACITLDERAWKEALSVGAALQRLVEAVVFQATLRSEQPSLTGDGQGLGVETGLCPSYCVCLSLQQSAYTTISSLPSFC